MTTTTLIAKEDGSVSISNLYPINRRSIFINPLHDIVDQVWFFSYGNNE